MMNLRAVQPACLIDINRLSALDYIRDVGDVIAIGRGPDRQPLPLHRVPDHCRFDRSCRRDDEGSTAMSLKAFIPPSRQKEKPTGHYKWIGESLKRLEDPKLLLGRRTYIDDV
jgi:hypothetical protein